MTQTSMDASIATARSIAAEGHARRQADPQEVRATRNAAEAFLAVYAVKLLTEATDNLHSRANRWNGRALHMGVPAINGTGWEGYARAAADYLVATHRTRR